MNNRISCRWSNRFLHCWLDEYLLGRLRLCGLEFGQCFIFHFVVLQLNDNRFRQNHSPQCLSMSWQMRHCFAFFSTIKWNEMHSNWRYLIRRFIRIFPTTCFQQWKGKKNAPQVLHVTRNDPCLGIRLSMQRRRMSAESRSENRYISTISRSLGLVWGHTTAVEVLQMKSGSTHHSSSIVAGSSRDHDYK